MKKFAFLILGILWLTGCDAPWFPGAWKTYSHPTFRFTLKVPAKWETVEDTPFGAAVLFREPDDDPLFRSSVNVLVEELKDPEIKLDQLTELSEKQLFVLLRDYRVLSRAPLDFQGVPAREIRGKYFGSEGERRIRTVLCLHRGMQYVLTFSTSALAEPALQKTFNRILDSFHFEKT